MIERTFSFIHRTCKRIDPMILFEVLIFRRKFLSGFLSAIFLVIGSVVFFPVALNGCSGGGGEPETDGAVDSGHEDVLLDDSAPPSDVFTEVDAYTPICGNDEVEEGEVCDDGNTVSGDGCNSTCTLIDSWDYVASLSNAGDQSQPTVACNANIIAAAWTDWSGFDSDGAGVRVRLFGTDAMPIETIFGSEYELTANTIATGHQHQPSIAIFEDSKIVVVWTDESGLGGDAGDIRMQIYEPDGSRVGSEILVNTTTNGDQQTPALEVLDIGVIFVVWADGSGEEPDTEPYAIRGRIFSDSGEPLTNGVTGDASDFVVNTVTAGIQRDPAITHNGAGGFLVAWTDGSGAFDDDGYGITAVITDADGAILTEDFGVNSSTNGHQFGPKAVFQSGYGPVLFWTDGSLTDDLQETGIRGRLLQSGGSFRLNYLGDDNDFPVNTITAMAQELPSVTAQSDGTALVVWQDWSGSDGSASAIVGRALDVMGDGVTFSLSSDGHDFLINTTFIGAQHSPVVCNTGLWSIAFWTDESETPPGEDGNAIRFRILPEI